MSAAHPTRATNGSPALARKDEVKEVLVNLLENARNAEAKRVTVQIAASGRQLMVIDDGRGIDRRRSRARYGLRSISPSAPAVEGKPAGKRRSRSIRIDRMRNLSCAESSNGSFAGGLPAAVAAATWSSKNFRTQQT